MGNVIQIPRNPRANPRRLLVGKDQFFQLLIFILFKNKSSFRDLRYILNWNSDNIFEM